MFLLHQELISAEGGCTSGMWVWKNIHRKTTRRAPKMTFVGCGRAPVNKARQPQYGNEEVGWSNDLHIPLVAGSLAVSTLVAKSVERR